MLFPLIQNYLHQTIKISLQYNFIVLVLFSCGLLINSLFLVDSTSDLPSYYFTTIPHLRALFKSRHQWLQFLHRNGIMDLGHIAISLVLEGTKCQFFPSPSFRTLVERGNQLQRQCWWSRMLEGRLSITTLKVTIGSSPLDDLSSLQCLFDKRPSFNPVFAFFSWTSANFPLLNLVAIPKKEKGGGIISKEKSSKGRLIFTKSIHLLFLTVSMFFWTWLEGFGPRKWTKRDCGEMSSSKSKTLSMYPLTFSKQLWYHFFKWEQIESIKKRKEASISQTWRTSSRMRKTNERRIRHGSAPTTKQLESVIWTFTWDGFPTITRDKEQASFPFVKRRGIKNQPWFPIPRLKLLIDWNFESS